MADNSGCTLDENTRRYYLDAMGIQCWQSLAPEDPVPERSDPDRAGSAQGVDRDGAGQAPAGNTGLTRAADSEAAMPPAADAGPDQPLPLPEIIARCRACGLHQARLQAGLPPVFERGNRAAELVFVLAAPETADEQAGSLCSGEAGELFRKMLAAIDIDIDDVFITTLLKCSVPATHTVTPAEVNACQRYLEQQLQVIQPRLVIALGEVAAQCLLQKDRPLDALRDEINPAVRRQGGQAGTAPALGAAPLLLSYSPHELLREAKNKRKAWADLQLLQSLISGD